MGGLHVSHLWLFIAFIPINTDNRFISPQLGRLPSGGKLDNRAPGSVLSGCSEGLLGDLKSPWPPVPALSRTEGDRVQSPLRLHPRTLMASFTQLPSPHGQLTPSVPSIPPWCVPDLLMTKSFSKSCIQVYR